MHGRGFFAGLGFLFLFGLVHTVWAQDKSTPVPAECTAFVAQFFDKVKEDKTKEAVDLLPASSPSMMLKTEALISIRLALDNIRKKSGPFKSFDAVIAKKISESVVYLFGFAVYQNQLVTVEFIFYKPDDKWCFYNIDFTTNDVAQTVRDLGHNQFNLPLIRALEKSTPRAPAAPSP